MPVRHSLLASLPTASVEPVDMPTPVIDAATAPAPLSAAPSSPSAGGSSGPVPQGRLKKCDTAVTLQERRSGGMSGRLLRSLAPSRASLSASVTVVRPALRHAVTLSSLEQARQASGCSRCGSQQALRLPAERRATCGVCLAEVPAAELHRLAACGCRFCRECMSTYVSVCVDNGETLVPCPEPRCAAGGSLTPDEVRRLTDDATFRRYQRLAYIREVEQDPDRAWCPRPGCDTACVLPASGQPFNCTGCGGRFCAVCRRPRPEPEDTPHECRPERWLLGGSQMLGGTVKKCPHCGVPIEREDGCAQMMCRRCRHTFCWYCLASLDGDLFLRHYDSGPCRRLLGHSRGSLIWHRVQLVGALIGVGLVFVVAAPVLILYAPVVMCTSCQCDPSGTELDSTPVAEGAQQLTSPPPEDAGPPPD